MKLLTVTVPCYNSAAYMAGAIDSLLPGGDEMDIIIIDDGSSDMTGEIADRYAADYPDRVRVIHQPNGGHGEGINQGIRHAQGLYFKVVDSDDRLDLEALKGLLDRLRGFEKQRDYPDLIVHDYCYDREKKQNVFSVRYGLVFRPEETLEWRQVKRFPASKQFMIHCMIYRTQLLRDIGLELPKHIFYEDNLYIYRPLPSVKRVYYYPAILYGYQIGREGQSVDEKVILRRLDQQTEISCQQATSFKLAELECLPKTLKNYMLNAVLGQLSTVSALQFIANTELSMAMNRNMWHTIFEFDERLYKKLRSMPLGIAITLPGKPGRKLVVWAYRLVRRIIHF